MLNCILIEFFICLFRFIEHGTQAEQLDQAGLSADQIANTALTMLGKKKGLLLPHVNGVHVA